jgi:hypothetical protein
MSGLSLRTGLSVGGSYTPLTPASGMPPSASSTIAQQAYGISGSGGTDVGPRTAALGTVSVGLISIGVLVYLWWSLPR